MFGTRKLGRTSDQRRAMLRAMTTYLLESGKIETTFYRAKEVQPVVEPAEVEQEVQPAQEQAKSALEIQAEGTRAKIYQLVSKYNEHKAFGEIAKMAAVKKEIDEKISDYTSEKETIALNKLRDEENPMLALANSMTFSTVSAREPKATKDMTVSDVVRLIDPINLNEKVSGGIGVNRKWPHMIQRLNYALTAFVMLKLGLEPNKVFKDVPFTMEEEAARLSCFKSNVSSVGKIKMTKAEEDLLLNDLQTVVDAMIPGLKVEHKHLWELLVTHCKFDNGKVSKLTSARDTSFRMNIMRIVSQLVTGAEIEVKYQTK